MKDKYKAKKTRDTAKKNDKKKEAEKGWTLFSDFHDITHIVIKESTVTIYRQDNMRMVQRLISPSIFGERYGFLLRSCYAPLGRLCVCGPTLDCIT